MKKIILGILVAVALSGCVKSPTIEGQYYNSLEHSFRTQAPEEWNTSLTAPSWLPVWLIPNNKRYTESAFIFNTKIQACILVESTQLTWAKKNIHPMDITWDSTGPERFKSVCQQLHSMKQQKLNSSASVQEYKYSCELLPKGSGCFLPNKCLESTVDAIFTVNPDFFMREQTFIVGKKFNLATEDMPFEGWRINYVLYAPLNQKEQSMSAFQKVINSTMSLNQ